MTKDSRRLHTKYRRTYIASTPRPPVEPGSTDMFPEDLDDILPLKKPNTPPLSADANLPPPATSTLPLDPQIEWECAAAAFKQLAYNYSVMLGRTPRDCERDLRLAMEVVIKRFPDYRATQFYDDTMKS